MRYLIASTILGFALAASAQTPLPNTKPDPRALDGIAHFAVRVSDIDASIAFYQKLGFVRAFEMKDKAGVPTEEFIKINDTQFLELYPHTKPTDPIGWLHVCFESKNLQRVHDAYVAEGLTVPDVRRAGAGNYLMAYKGPDNMTLEYTQYIPGSLHTNDLGQHIGPDRVADHLAGAVIPTPNPEVVIKYFESGLGFITDPKAPLLHLLAPGAPEASFSIVSAAEKPLFLLTTPSLGKAEKTLKANGVPFERKGADLSLTDPDGNRLLIRAESAKQL